MFVESERGEVAGMAVSKAQQEAQNRWIAKTYDRVNLTLPKGQKEILQAHAAARGESMNGFIGRAVRETRERDNAPTPPAAADRGAGIALPADTLEIARQSAERTGEAVWEFIARAVEMQVRRDGISFQKGVDPATGKKLKKKK